MVSNILYTETMRGFRYQREFRNDEVYHTYFHTKPIYGWFSIKESDLSIEFGGVENSVKFFVEQNVRKLVEVKKK